MVDKECYFSRFQSLIKFTGSTSQDHDSQKDTSFEKLKEELKTRLMTPAQTEDEKWVQNAEKQHLILTTLAEKLKNPPKIAKPYGSPLKMEVKNHPVSALPQPISSLIS